MKIHDFVACLSMQERRRLANQISCSTGYLNQLARGEYFPSDDFIQRVSKSSLNQHLVPAKMRINDRDVEKHIVLGRARRVKRD